MPATVVAVVSQIDQLLAFMDLILVCVGKVSYKTFFSPHAMMCHINDGMSCLIDFFFLSSI